MATKVWRNRLLKFVKKHRFIFAVFFFLPAALVFELIFKTKRKINKIMSSITSKHDERVKIIRQEVLEWNKLPLEERKLLCTSRPNWLSLSVKFFRKDLFHQIPVDLFEILELDEKNMCVRVEPMVQVGDITKFLIPKGFTLAMTSDLRDATLGGLAMGAGMASNSHQVGLYQENVVSYEVILGDGSFVKASQEKHSDLFNALHISHGSLAFLVALTLKIVKIKPYIKVTYHPICRRAKNIAGAVKLYSGQPHPYYPNNQVSDFVESLVFDMFHSIIITGDYSDYDKNLPINHVNRWYEPWFYKYAKKLVNERETKHTELIPIEDYLFRHDRSIFWVKEALVPYHKKPLFRSFFGWLPPPKPSFIKYVTTPKIRESIFIQQVFQNIVSPMNELEMQLLTAYMVFETSPILIYPCKIYDHGENSGQIRRPTKEHIIQGTNYALYSNLGVYGIPGYVKRNEKWNAVDSMKEMYEFTRKVGGFLFLYADIIMDKQEFEEMYDLSLYEKVRKKYFAANAFPHLYDKVKSEINVFKVQKKYN